MNMLYSPTIESWKNKVDIIKHKMKRKKAARVTKNYTDHWRRLDKEAEIMGKDYVLMDDFCVYETYQPGWCDSLSREEQEKAQERDKKRMIGVVVARTIAELYKGVRTRDQVFDWWPENRREAQLALMRFIGMAPYTHDIYKGLKEIPIQEYAKMDNEMGIYMDDTIIEHAFKVTNAPDPSKDYIAHSDIANNSIVIE